MNAVNTVPLSHRPISRNAMSECFVCLPVSMVNMPQRQFCNRRSGSVHYSYHKTEVTVTIKRAPHQRVVGLYLWLPIYGYTDAHQASAASSCLSPLLWLTTYPDRLFLSRSTLWARNLAPIWSLIWWCRSRKVCDLLPLSDTTVDNLLCLTPERAFIILRPS